MKRMFLSTAAVLAGVALAGAQGGPQQPGEKQAPSAASERAQPNAAGQNKGDRLQQRDSRPAEREKGAQQAPRRDQKDNAPASAERPRGDDAKRDAQPKQREQDAQKADSKQDTRKADTKEDSKRDQDRVGQGQRESDQRARDQREQKDRNQQQDTNRQQGPTQQTPTAQQKDAPSDRPDRVQADAQGRVTLNTEQRTRIQRTVFTRSDVPRVSRVNFSVTVGTAVPSHITIVDVPPALIEINPEWRGYRYFVVEEEIVIVTPERRIVAVVPVGRSHAGSSGGATTVELPEAEVRILQQVLVERGFDIEVDGVWGPRTREALISFQRREGLQTTGQIDIRTVTALGVEGRVNVQSDSRSNAGQQTNSGGQEEPNAQRPSAQQPARQGNQRPDDDKQKTTGSGDPQENRQPGTPMRGSESGRQPEPQRSDAPEGRETPTQQRPSGAQKQ